MHQNDRKRMTRNPKRANELQIKNKTTRTYETQTNEPNRTQNGHKWRQNGHELVTKQQTGTKRTQITIH